jgi:hypothetical protein
VGLSWFQKTCKTRSLLRKCLGGRIAKWEKTHQLHASLDYPSWTFLLQRSMHTSAMTSPEYPIERWIQPLQLFLNTNKAAYERQLFIFKDRMQINALSRHSVMARWRARILNRTWALYILYKSRSTTKFVMREDLHVLKRYLSSAMFTDIRGNEM